ncbi:MAG: hypothetical protein WCA14_03700 [Steroidobacteraceae bacterium]
MAELHPVEEKFSQELIQAVGLLFVTASFAETSVALLRTLRLTADGSLRPPKPYTADQIIGFAATLHTRVRELDDLLRAAGLASWDDVLRSLKLLAQEIPEQ